MWLHESESNSIITEAYENKIFLTIIYISNNSHHKGRAAIRHYPNQTARPLRLLCRGSNFTLRD